MAIHARCGKWIGSRIGCKCTDGPPPSFPRKDPATGLWYRPDTGEVVEIRAAKLPEPRPQEQLELLDFGPADAVREGIAAARAALRGR